MIPKSTGVIMSAPMILALNAGRKTQTRRTRGLDEGFGPGARVMGHDRDAKGRWGAYIHRELHPDPLVFVPCPYGGPGDELWFREGIHRLSDDEQLEHAAWAAAFPPGKYRTPIATYIADEAPTAIDNWGWKNSALPAIHMPRGLCRHFGTLLEGVRAERLLEITEADSIAEGMEPRWSFLAAVMQRGGPTDGPTSWRWPTSDTEHRTARDAYFAGWDSLHGDGDHKRNPLVWRLPFTPRRK